MIRTSRTTKRGHKPDPRARSAPAISPLAPPSNAEVAAIFYDLAELLQLEGGEPFRALAYRRAAGAINRLPSRVASLVARGADLAALPFIGEGIAAEIREICVTGRLRALEEAEARTPRGMLALSRLPGLGPKRLAVLRDVLHVTAPAALRKAAAQGRVRGLPLFSSGLEARLLAALSNAEGAET